MGSWRNGTISYTTASLSLVGASLLGLVAGGALAAVGAATAFKIHHKAHLNMLVQPKQGVVPYVAAGDTITWYEKDVQGTPKLVPSLYFNQDKGSDDPCVGNANPCKIKKGLEGHTAFYNCADCLDPTMPIGSTNDTFADQGSFALYFFQLFSKPLDEPKEDVFLSTGGSKGGLETSPTATPGLDINVFCDKKKNVLAVSPLIPVSASTLGNNVSVTWLNGPLDLGTVTIAPAAGARHPLSDVCTIQSDDSGQPVCTISGTDGAPTDYDYTVTVEKGCGTLSAPEQLKAVPVLKTHAASK